MAGASLIPDYYREKVKVACFLAPPASIYYNPNKILQAIAHKTFISAVEDVAWTVNFLDWLPHEWFYTDTAVYFCKFTGEKLCELYLKFFTDSDPSVDNFDRIDVFLSNEPTGASAFSTLHYGQLLN